jgi:hypothetical protein
MRFSTVFKRVQHAGFPAGYYHAHVPSLALRTRGPEIEGARGEAVAAPSEILFGTLRIPEGALQSA